MQRHFATLVTLAFLGLTMSRAGADEPNETFDEATILGPGVLLVADELFPAEGPDTLLGSRGLFGGIDRVDDDGSPEGDGTASALYDVPTNSGTVSFSVTGFGDDFFDGTHAESGMYEAQVIIRDLFGDTVDDFFVNGELSPGVVDDYDFSDPDYINGDYDVVINNIVGGGDVDFFTFTGLAAGTEFTAETLDPHETGVDTILGWFDDSGSLVDQNDDGDNDTLLSLLEGTVPASGQLTFVVAGFPDFDFTGAHSEDSTYELRLTVDTALTPGDFDGDGDVDSEDFLRWQRGASPMPGSPEDLAAWQSNFGTEAPLAAANSNITPEPTTCLALSIGLLAMQFRRGRRRAQNG